MQVSGTPEFDAYGAAHIPGFSVGSFDVAALRIDFTLPKASQIQFDFIFGAIEYPNYVNQFADSFLVFLDGLGDPNQITFDKNGSPIDVGNSFVSQLKTNDVNTAFSNPHALIGPLTTTSNMLSAGPHTLYFEVGDVNDHILDSAAFIGNLRTGSGQGGTGPVVPEPASLVLLVMGGLGCVAATSWRRLQLSSHAPPRL
jgi:hypothetical protein